MTEKWEGSEAYKAYLRSQEWRAKREHALLLADDRCQVCYSPDDLEVHHRTYERVFEEDPLDLTVLCSTCHGMYHDRMGKHEPVTLSGGQRSKRNRLWLSRGGKTA